MRAGQGWLRRLLVTLAGALALTACESPDDPGHRVFGYVDSSGREVIDPQYRNALAFHEGLAAVQAADGWGYIDTAGRWVIRPAYEAAGSFSNDRAVVLDAEGARGYIDRSGKTVIPHRYREAGDFIGERAIVSPDGDRMQVINRNGEVISELRFSNPGSSGAREIGLDQSLGAYWGLTLSRLFEEMWGRVQSERVIPLGNMLCLANDVGRYVDVDGKPIGAAGYQAVNAFVEGRAQVCLDRKYGFIDRTGRLVVEPKYDYALLRFSRGRTVAVHDDHAWVVDTDGRDVADLGAWPWPTVQGDESFNELMYYVGHADFFANGLLPWQRDGRWGYVGPDGSWAIAPQFEMAQPFHAGFASVQADGRGQLIDVKGRVVASVPRGWWIAPSGGDRLMVGTSTRWGFADPDGKVPHALPYATTRVTFANQTFADAHPLQFSEGLALVSRVAHHRWQVFDLEGRRRATGRYTWVQDVGGGRYAVGTEDGWALADRSLKMLSRWRLPEKPELYLASERSAFVAQGDRAGCLDWDGNWRALPRGIDDADCDGPLIVARVSTGERNEGVLSRSDQWIVPPTYESVWRLEGVGAGCFELRIATPGNERIERIVCIESGKPRYSEPRQTKCVLQQVCFQRDASGWRRLDFRSLQPVGPAYAEVGNSLSGHVDVKLGARWGLLATSGEVSVPAEFDEIRDVATFEGACRSALAVRRGALVGVVHADGREILPGRYDEVRCLQDGMFAVRVASRWGVVGERGEVVVPPAFDEILLLRDGLLLAKSGDTLQLQKLSGEPLLDPAPPWLQRVHQLSDFSASLWAVFTLDRELYFIDKQTRAVHRVDPPSGHAWLPPDYFPGYPDDVSGVKSNGFSGFLYVKPAGASPSTGRGPVSAVVVDAGGRTLPWLFDGVGRAADFPGGHYVVYLRGKCGVVDEHGRWPVPLGHDHCETLEGGLVLVGDEDY